MVCSYLSRQVASFVSAMNFAPGWDEKMHKLSQVKEKLEKHVVMSSQNKEVRNTDGWKRALNQADDQKVKPLAFTNKPIDKQTACGNWITYVIYGMLWYFPSPEDPS